MVNIAQGHTPWLAPTVGGLPADGALLPYWIGAVFIRLLGPWVDPAFAARIPFALLLVLVLVLTWYATYHLARTEAAQPLPFAFGGEAEPIDYARAIADGAAARADRLARPAAARPRDHARARAARERRAVRLRPRGQPVPRRAGARRGARRAARAGRERRAQHRARARRGRRRDLPCVVVRTRAALHAVDRGEHRARRAARHAARRLGLARQCLQPVARRRVGAAAAARLVHLAGLAAGAVDDLALARATCRTATSRSRSAAPSSACWPASRWAARSAR